VLNRSNFRGFLFLISVIGLIGLVVVFQNCSGAKTQFSEVAPVEAVFQQNEPTMKAELLVPPADNTPKPIEFVFLIDASFSNKVYAQTIATAMKNFIDQLPESALEVRVYLLTGQKQILKKETTYENLSSTLKKSIIASRLNPESYKVVRSPQMSIEDFRSSLSAVFSQVSEEINAVPSGGADSTPAVREELLALMRERSGQGTKSRTVYMIVTDEDTGKNTNKPYNKYTYNSQAVQTTTGGMYVVPVNCKKALEGGGTGYTACEFKGCPSCVPQINSCGDTAGINKAISSSNGFYSKSDTTFSGCYFESVKTTTGWQKIASSTEMTDYLGRLYSGTTANSQLTTVEDQIAALAATPNQPQFFIGLFSIMSSADLKNSDQEISVNIQNFLNSITTAENRSYQPISVADYSNFIEKVTLFKLRTENNRFSIAAILASVPNDKNLVIKSVSIFDDKTQRFNRSDKYSRSGDEIVIQDLSVDFQSGGKISLEYGFE
jgi:hypothetical protein